VRRTDGGGTVGGVTRIVSGVYGGRRIMAPSGRDTRPTSDRVREALFSTLDTMIDLDGARFADLFAGSGAVGLEAASRGAARVLLVESDAAAARTARKNVEVLSAGRSVTVVADRVERVVRTPPAEPFDVVFADPPYAQSVDELIVALAADGWLAEEAVVCLERSRRGPDPVWVEGITPVSSRRYGETTLWYGRRS
jgi:16S rRNA (guanine966-N2)-methyltransferase